MTEAPEFPADTTPLGTIDEELSVLDPDLDAWHRDMDGLLFLGALTGSFSWCGHEIVIKTLSTDEEIIVGQITAGFQATIAGPKAYATAMVALALQFIDGHPMPTPLGETGSGIQWATERFNWARRLFPPTIDAVYDAYLALERRQKKVLEEMGKASGPGAGATPGSNPGSEPLPGAGSSPGGTSP